MTVGLIAIVAVAGAVAGGRSAPAAASAARWQTHADAELEAAQRLFYNGRYDEAATLMAGSCVSAADLARCELRTSALLFRIKRAMGDEKDKARSWKACDVCQAVMPAFLADTATGQIVARAHLRANPSDAATLFFLGKLDLNYVWLQLGMRGEKTGWKEYWEARRSLDRVLKLHPGHVRAKVARAWIDYIVDTKMPRGTRWLLGGGNKKRGLLAVREAANAPTDFFSQTEAEFAVWDMHVRERQWSDAIAAAQRLSRDFPDNPDLRKFLLERQAPSE